MKSRRRPIGTTCSFALLALFLAGCSSSSPSTTAAAASTAAAPASSEPASTETVATEPGTTPPITTDPVTTNLVTPEPATTVAAVTGTSEPLFGDTTPPPSANPINLPLTAVCTAPTTAVEKEGELTFVSQGKVWAVGTAGTARCLYNLNGRSISQLTWSPDSTAVLLGPDQVARGAKLTPSGYLPTNTDVEWSGPKGTSLLAATAKGQLVKRNSRTGVRTDISYLDRHARSAYHPAGKAIASIGEGSDGTGVDGGGDTTVGIWFSDNLGGGSELRVQDGSGATLSEIGFTANGDFLFFIAQHPDGFHLHEYNVNSPQISVAFESPDALSNLVLSASDDSVAVQRGSCDGTSASDVMYRPTGATEFVSLRSKAPSLGDGWVSPVGWLPDGRLAVLSRRKGCAGPGTLHVIDTTTGKDTTIADQISIAAVRSPHAIPNDLALDIGSQVVA